MSPISSYVNNMRSRFALCPYIPGATLTLNCTSDDALQSAFKGPVKVKIIKVISSEGHSVILEAKPLGESSSKNSQFPRCVVIKLFDHRFSARLRSEEGIEPPTRSSIREYLTYVSAGGAKRFIKRLHHHDKTLHSSIDELSGTTVVNTSYTGSYPDYLPSSVSSEHSSSSSRSQEDSVRSMVSSVRIESIPDDWNDDSPLSHWTPAQNETYLYHKAHKRFQIEKNVYHRLRRLQGVAVPSVLGMASVKIGFPSFNPLEGDEFGSTEKYKTHKRLFNASAWVCVTGVDSHLLSVKALILEKIDGFSMADMTAYAPRCLFTTIVEEAMQIIHSTGIAPCEILHKNIRPENFIVEYKEADGYRVVMIDFSECEVREPEESDERWYLKKWRQKEVATLGVKMETMFRRIGYEYRLDQHDTRTTEWARYLF